jgi:hypothetical protein
MVARASVSMKRIMLACVLAVACQDLSSDDGADDSFLDDGKGDTGGIHEDTASGYAVLRVANESNAAALAAAGVTSGAVSAVLAHRAGPDGQLATADDDRFDTLAELDAVPYTGPVFFHKLLEHATALSYLVIDWRTHIFSPGWSSQTPTVCMVRGAADAQQLKLLFDLSQSKVQYINIRDSSGTTVQQIAPPFIGWSNPVAGNALTYQVYSDGAYRSCEHFRYLLEGVAAKQLVSVGDPFRCTTSVTMNPPLAGDAMNGKVGDFSLPNLAIYGEHAAVIGGSKDGVAIKYTPQTDGLYYFNSYPNRVFTIRDGGCDGPQIGGGGNGMQVKLRKGQPVVIGVRTLEPSVTWFSIVRSLEEVECSDGFDDNADGIVDCADPACAEACRVKEVCTNGIDDTNDGDVDCLDADCSTSTSCSANACPGLDLGSSLGSPVAGGNGTLVPAGETMSCGAFAVPWQKSRFYRWRAPTAGTYRFTLDAIGFYNAGIKVLNGTCAGGVLGCDLQGTTPGSVLTMALAANQQIVIEVGLSRFNLTDLWPWFDLSITKQ